MRASLLVVAVLTSVLAVVWSTRGGDAPGRSGDTPTRVVGVGDSLMLLAAPNIRRTLDPEHTETIIARNGRRIDEMLPALQAALHRARSVRAVITNLGTNNVIQAASYHGTLGDFDRLVAITEAVPCVIFTTISTRLDDWRDTRVGAEINAQIRRLVAKDPRKYQVVDWDAAIRAPGGAEHLLVEPDGIYDGIHENDTAGRQWFADQYAEALSRCPGPGRP